MSNAAAKNKHEPGADKLEKDLTRALRPKWFPLQTESVRGPNAYKLPQRTRIPWDIAEKAYGTASQQRSIVQLN